MTAKKRNKAASEKALVSGIKVVTGEKINEIITLKKYGASPMA